MAVDGRNICRCGSPLLFLLFWDIAWHFLRFWYIIRAFIKLMHEWLSGGVSPCQGEGRGFESRLVLLNIRRKGESRLYLLLRFTTSLPPLQPWPWSNTLIILNIYFFIITSYLSYIMFRDQSEKILYLSNLSTIEEREIFDGVCS